ncbi:hypothetical protein DPMN_089651 [Dreissena polymorpha]|uniref:Uncharacterized protein n=1 Tax=Dreissena polymorpha TaxID=45954 RepID=A0A9D4KYQ2_DREPO|nr:hypothetical protein DPMN_089651 [Dreissena polymorpha]
MSDREPAGPTAKEEPSTTAKYAVKVKPATYDGVGAWADYKAHLEACAKLNGWDSDQKAMYLCLSRDRNRECMETKHLRMQRMKTWCERLKEICSA